MLVNSYDVLKLMFLYKIGRPFDKFQSLLQFGVQEQTTNILSWLFSQSTFYYCCYKLFLFMK